MWGCFALLGLAVASPAIAQQRTPSTRQALVELSRVIGESHALRQACKGAGDQFWRVRMQQLLGRDASEPALKTLLSVAFNDGYHAAQERFPKCGKAARTEARRIAASGKALSERLEAP